MLAVRKPPRPELLTRVEVARMLQVSKTRVVQFERAGKLKGERDPAGVNWFRREDVLELAKTRRKPIYIDGTLCALIFEHFEKGTSFAQIVILTKQTPQVVIDLREQYERGYGHGTKSLREIMAGSDEMGDAIDREIEERRRLARERSSGG